MKSRKPKVSVCIITFNHEKFITAALDSILEQDIDFQIEIVAVDDASTDNTHDILNSYSRKNPEIVRIYQNPFNLGPYRNFLKALQLCSGQYIAICEGDDFWISTSKLKKQVAFLDKEADYAGCIHDAIVTDADGRVTASSYCNHLQNKFDLKDSMKSLRGRFPTCSLLVRASILNDNPPQWFTSHACDTFFLYLAAKTGYIRYMEDKMSAYRIHSQGTWQGSNNTSRRRGLLLQEKILWSDRKMRTTCGEIIRSRIQVLSHEIAVDENESKTMRLHALFLRTRHGFSNFKTIRVSLGILIRILR
ncbi:glycosyltransferase [Synechococcus sp. MW101C3]|uniref:glycosyltransferase n=1 Tax=Synechococcus sp. MW101C3 TaxID=210768 RepID=UPI000B9963AE|nr:glycosyltransferase [Synechococcus sp. MW101C3]